MKSFDLIRKLNQQTNGLLEAIKFKQNTTPNELHLQTILNFDTYHFKLKLINEKYVEINDCGQINLMLTNTATNPNNTQMNRRLKNEILKPILHHYHCYFQNHDVIHIIGDADQIVELWNQLTSCIMVISEYQSNNTLSILQNRHHIPHP